MFCMKGKKKLHFSEKTILFPNKPIYNNFAFIITNKLYKSPRVLSKKSFYSTCAWLEDAKYRIPQLTFGQIFFNIHAPVLKSQLCFYSHLFFVSFEIYLKKRNYLYFLSVLKTMQRFAVQVRWWILKHRSYVVQNKTKVSSKCRIKLLIFRAVRSHRSHLFLYSQLRPKPLVLKGGVTFCKIVAEWLEVFDLLLIVWINWAVVRR